MKLDRALALAAFGAGLAALLGAAILNFLQVGPKPAFLLIMGAALLVCAAILDPSFLAGIVGTRRGRIEEIVLGRTAP